MGENPMSTELLFCLVFESVIKNIFSEKANQKKSANQLSEN
jgi:hypothetical protein